MTDHLKKEVQLKDDAKVNKINNKVVVRACRLCDGVYDLHPSVDSKCAGCQLNNICAACSHQCIECLKEFCVACRPNANSHFLRCTNH